MRVHPGNRYFFSRIWLPTAVNLLMACLLTAIGFLDVLITPIGSWQVGQPAPTSYRSPALTRTSVDAFLQAIGASDPSEDRFVVRRGDPVSQADLDALKRLVPGRQNLDPVRALGVWAFYFLALMFFTLALRRTGHLPQMRFRAVTSMYVVLLIIALASRLLFDRTNLSQYVAPTSLAVFLFAPLLPQSLAWALHLLAVALVAPMLGFSPGMILIPLASGWTASMLLKRDSGSVTILLSAVAAAAVGLIFMLGLAVVGPRSFDWGIHMGSDLIGLGAGNLAAGLLAVLVVYPTTLMFGGVPKSKLISLRDMDHPVLKDLAEEAPGTFQHTLAVANMAEKVADDIGADAKLVRVGAYYHDIGKMRGPDYFVENQQGENPHDRLSPEASVEKLRGHVTNGLTIAKGANLPDRVIDFIIEHHGSAVMDYFLDKASQAEGNRLPAKGFSYQGRNPSSRETAILMIVDAAEAASRTLKAPDHQQIEQLIRQILFEKLYRGYLDDSGLTTRDLKQISQTLVRYLEAQFHVRIEYPWQRQESKESRGPSQNGQGPGPETETGDHSDGPEEFTPDTPT